jgi:hypothetical protein
MAREESGKARSIPEGRTPPRSSGSGATDGHRNKEGDLRWNFLPFPRYAAKALPQQAGPTCAADTATLATIAANRQSDPNRLGQFFRAELDWIVMKCLEKDRNRRYETANGLARDIQRYLNDEPVQACPPSTSYRVRKFMRKHQRVVLTAAGLVGLLVAGTGVSTWQAARATRAVAVAGCLQNTDMKQAGVAHARE